MQVHVELDVGKIGRQIVRQMNRKSGLAHAGGAGNHQDHPRSGRPAGDRGTEPVQFRIPSRKGGNVGRELMRCVQPRSEHVGLPVRSVRSVDLQSSPLVEGYQRPGRNAQLRFVGLDDVDGSQPVAPLVLDQGAVRTVQPPREASERDTAALSSAAKSGAQTDLRARVGRLPPPPMDHASILPYNGQTSIASLVGLSSDHAATSARSEPMVGRPREETRDLDPSKKPASLLWRC